MKKLNLNKIKKQLILRYKKGLDETPILEKLEDHYHIDLTHDYGNDSPKEINELFKKLAKLEEKSKSW